MPDDDDDREEQRAREEGTRVQQRDRALARLDEQEVKGRMVDALDAFIAMGFAAHLIGVTVRGAIAYSIALYPDGTDSIPSVELQAAADEFRLDYTISKSERATDGWAIMLYPRW